MKTPARLLACAVLLVLANGTAPAETSLGPAPTLHWRCWYDRQVHIVCLLDKVPETSLQPIPELPSNLPEIVRMMRTNPALFRKSFIHIPLRTQPFDQAFPALLARSTVCGSRPDCTVYYTGTPPTEGEIAALLGLEPSAPAAAPPALPAEDDVLN